MRNRSIIAAMLAAAVAGCGVVYTSPSVRDGNPLGQASGTDYKVEVIALTEESARAANLETYVPPRLPLAFQPGISERARAEVRGTLPSQLTPTPTPQFREERRPAFIADRFPPLGQPEPYRLGAGDVVLLSVDGAATTVEQLSGLISAQNKRQGYVVQDDGAIAIPDIGRVQVGGMTLQDAESEIFRALVSAGIDPAFSLEVAEFNSRVVTVGGEVREPQLLPLGLRPLYLHEAIQTAGGLTVVDPSVTKVQLFRGAEVYQIGGERFLSDPSARRIVLRDGDSIYVASEFNVEAAERFFDQQLAIRQTQIQQTQSALTLNNLISTAQNNALARESAERDIFKERLELGAIDRPYAYVAGEVRRTSRIALPFERKFTLADVLFAESVNGIEIETADYAEIYVLRGSDDPRLAGKLTAYHLDAENVVNMVAATRMEIQPNDVIFVAEQPITAWNRVISQILPQIFLQAANVANN